MKKALFFVLIVMIVCSFGFAKVYRVGTSAGFPPFEFVENGEFVGFDMDLMREIAKEMGFEIEIIDMSFDSLIAGLVSGNLDVIAAGMTITEQRAKVVDFSDAYWTADQSISVKADSDFDLTVLFGKHNIGVQTGTTGDLWVEEALEKTGILTGNYRRYDTFVLAMTDLENENLDAVILDSPVADRFAKVRPVKTVGIIKSDEKYGLAVKKGNKALLDMLNEGMKKLEENGKIDELIAKYF
ncbi:MAG TPA: basic amino acid ABC transporter substrate-binding protein [Thermotogota bacterium]|nr:basic amino acid ABC transporter substrate-binding protein [Thermotogota bacterium]HPJ87760.1 basic amino acid ABC transporter substrate-binding protein [Thermotogota bacterium]HPR95242.1 basic amino acid ABC transporter substrate-binding protein [Thermotogota bacterium]